MRPPPDVRGGGGPRATGPLHARMSLPMEIFSKEGQMRKRATEQQMPPAGPTVATVTNLYLKAAWMNPQLVSGLVDGRSVRVRCKDRRALAPGMTLAVKRIEEGLYEEASRHDR